MKLKTIGSVALLAVSSAALAQMTHPDGAHPMNNTHMNSSMHMNSSLPADSHDHMDNEMHAPNEMMPNAM